jgi:hypothetical protein
MVLIQLLLPISAQEDAAAEKLVAQTRAEIVERFGGVTAYVQTPAHGEWIAPGGRRDRDQLVMVEVVAPTFDRSWWRNYADTLARRFAQEAIHVRALPVELLDDDAS